MNKILGLMIITPTIWLILMALLPHQRLNDIEIISISDIYSVDDRYLINTKAGDIITPDKIELIYRGESILYKSIGENYYILYLNKEDIHNDYNDNIR